MNKQLEKYVSEQSRNGVNPEYVKYNLVKSGWNSKDIDNAIWKYYSPSRKPNFKHNPHLTRNLIILVGVLVMVLFVVYSYILLSAGPGVNPVSPVDPLPTNPVTLINVEMKCSDYVSSVEKDACYRAKVQEGFDCDELTDTVERNFCFRAVDIYLRT